MKNSSNIDKLAQFLNPPQDSLFDIIYDWFIATKRKIKELPKKTPTWLKAIAAILALSATVFYSSPFKDLTDLEQTLNSPSGVYDN